MQVKKQQLELDMEQKTGSISGKEYVKAMYCLYNVLYIYIYCLFNLYAEHIMGNSGLDEAQAGVKTAGRNISNLKYADDTILMEESEE